MKLKGIITVLSAFLMFIAGDMRMVSAYTELSPKTSVESSGTIPFLGPQALLDNFDSGKATNAWNCSTGTFAKEGTTATCAVSYTSDQPYGETGLSLRINYNVNDTGSYAGYNSNLSVMPAHLGDLSGYTAISFYVRGSVGGELFKVQLKNNSGNNIYNAPESYPGAGDATTYSRNIASVYVNDYLDGGVTTSWQKVTIPFHNFANLDNWTSCMVELDIVFENSQSAASGSPTQGTVYIDNITFENSVINNVRVAHFGEAVALDDQDNNRPQGICAIGGNMGKIAGNSATISRGLSNTVNEYSPYIYGFSLTYNVAPANAYAGAYLIFGGGNTNDQSTQPIRGGWIAIPHDFSAYSWLIFKIKAKSEAENPKGIKVQIVDNISTKDTLISGISGTTWKTYGVPLSTGKSSIKQVNFVLDDWWIADAANNGSKTGTIYIDSVEFRKTYP